MDEAEIRFRCDAGLWRRFAGLAAAADETPGALLRELVRLEVQRRERAAKARRSEAPDERLLVRLRLLVARALAAAKDWDSLGHALASQGLAYRAEGGGLVVTDRATGAILCKGSEVGPGYAALIRRFRAPFPGHPQAGLAARILSAT